MTAIAGPSNGSSPIRHIGNGSLASALTSGTGRRSWRLYSAPSWSLPLLSRSSFTCSDCPHSARAAIIRCVGCPFLRSEF